MCFLLCRFSTRCELCRWFSIFLKQTFQLQCRWLLNYFVRRCRSRQIFGMRKIFARISPNLPKRFRATFCANIFSHADHEDFSLGWPPKKRSSCDSANVGCHLLNLNNVGRHFSRIFREFAQILKILPWFAGILPGFRQIETFGVHLHLLHLRLLHPWFCTFMHFTDFRMPRKIKHVDILCSVRLHCAIPLCREQATFGKDYRGTV